MQDQTLQCRDCGKSFIWTVGEQEFYKQKGFDNAPVRCPACRSNKKAARQGGNDKNFPITCSSCGKQDTVPFEPKPGGKPVLCKDCFKKSRTA